MFECDDDHDADHHDDHDNGDDDDEVSEECRESFLLFATNSFSFYLLLPNTWHATYHRVDDDDWNDWDDDDVNADDSDDNDDNDDEDCRKLLTGGQSCSPPMQNYHLLFICIDPAMLQVTHEIIIIMLIMMKKIAENF